jgi:mRNA-degrading endonuclease toxin of MazEF toxin-antitoxin module
MAFPDPQLGLVISYGYLWHREYRKGTEEGRKSRPCVIILSKTITANGDTVVRVAPITHSQPEDLSLAIEIPAAVKRHLGLEDDRSWIILDELNVFTWPGFDVRPITKGPGRMAYGFLPPAFFSDLIIKTRVIWLAGKGKLAPRD